MRCRLQKDNFFGTDNTCSELRSNDTEEFIPYPTAGENPTDLHVLGFA